MILEILRLGISVRFMLAGHDPVVVGRADPDFDARPPDVSDGDFNVLSDQERFAFAAHGYEHGDASETDIRKGRSAEPPADFSEKMLRHRAESDRRKMENLRRFGGASHFDT